MKRSVAVLLSSAIMCGSLVSCGNSGVIGQNDQSGSSSSSAEKQFLTVVQIGTSDTNYEELVQEFNSKEELFQLSYKQYGDPADTYGDSAFEAFNSDLEAGFKADIVIAPPAKAAELKAKDFFTDLAPIMEREDGVKMSDFMENVASSFTENGAVYTLFNGFTIDTAAVKASRYGSDFTNWTPEQAIDAYNNRPYHSDLMCEQWNDEEAFRYMTNIVPMECVDRAGKTCDFSQLRSVLVFLKGMDHIGDRTTEMASMTPEESDEFLKTLQSKLANDQALVERITINGVNQWYPVDFSRFGGSDITFVGFPSYNGCGIKTNVETMVGISAACKEKSAAWMFVNTLFNEDSQVQLGLTGGKIPVLNKVIDKLAYDTPDTVEGSIRTVCDFPSSSEKYTITPEAVDQLVEYIRTAPVDPWHDDALERIVAEECDLFCTGQSSVEECVTKLGSRVNKYFEHN
ncbi:MAG TPA: ABC transporter substrate-binding protein [Ruminococcus sp.]|mgnify:FL=1|nr:ABC transporter substrate-binding protein [Ruminococcus sp.]